MNAGIAEMPVRTAVPAARLDVRIRPLAHFVQGRFRTTSSRTCTYAGSHTWHTCCYFGARDAIVGAD
jgi:hypothetical protein